ncbi:SH3 domain-containing protein [Chlorobium ferrooxidans]|uniref:SH3b domain-containing protein n=1 Tax=Chlorobium ferrooxidans DSM 13031 TaxID=377431 RepID=Q0YUB7_9CHLB|nr:SH3 domain-containing protein [Chlorobium ferrooxidans]EAT60150.1 hypothetical protein CferDRAFT_2157 [Chlorobium ferrooxidans DSM 13031]
MSKKNDDQESANEGLDASSLNSELMKRAQSVQDSFGSSSAISAAMKHAQSLQDTYGSNSAFSIAKKASQSVQDSFGSSSAISAAMKHAQSLQDTYGSNSAFSIAKKASQSVQDSFGSSSAISAAMKHAQSLQDTYGSNSAFSIAMKASQSVQDMFGSNSVISEAMKASQSIRDMAGSGSAISAAMKHAQSLQDMVGACRAISEVMKSSQSIRDMVGAGSVISEAMKSSTHMQEILSSSFMTLSNSQNFSVAVSLINQELVLDGYANLHELDTQEIESGLASLVSVDNSSAFSELFSRIPSALKMLLLFAFLQIVLPQLNSISANLLTPFVNELIQGVSGSTTSKVQTLKEVAPYLHGLPSENLRFISGNNVRLRNDPLVKSETLDLLRLGQIVVFLGKEKNWTHVMVQYDNGDTCSGWVLTRYVESFKR